MLSLTRIKALIAIASSLFPSEFMWVFRRPSESIIYWVNCQLHSLYGAQERPPSHLAISPMSGTPSWVSKAINSTVNWTFPFSAGIRHWVNQRKVLCAPYLPWWLRCRTSGNERGHGLDSWQQQLFFWWRWKKNGFGWYFGTRYKIPRWSQSLVLPVEHVSPGFEHRHGLVTKKEGSFVQTASWKIFLALWHRRAFAPVLWCV